jgi:hypothetical protein
MLAGHVRQLFGYALVFLGLGVAAGVFLTAGRYPTVPLWWFVSVAVVLGAPLMIAGGRLNARGRGQVMDIMPESATEEYHRQNVLMAAYLGFILAQGFLVATPVLARGTGLVFPSDTFVSVWVVVSMLALCAGREWVTRPVWRAIERRLLARSTSTHSANRPTETTGG